MAVTPYEEKKYVQSDAVTQAQQALTQQQANKPGPYQSQFQQGLNDLMGQIQNRQPFKYDVNGDALYQQVAQRYMQQGQQAMMDTMGQASALTGGYGNSYAETAGQQAYQNYLLGITDMVPQFQQMALEQYQMEGQDLLDKYALMQQQEDTAYGRYQDDLNAYFAELDRLQAAYDSERNYDYGKFSDDRAFEYGKYIDESNRQYQEDRDKVADDQWLQQWEHQQERARIEDEQWQQQYQEQIRQWNMQYNLQLQQLALQKAAAERAAAQYNSSYGNTSSYEPDTPTIDVAAEYRAMKEAGAKGIELDRYLRQMIEEGYISQWDATELRNMRW